MEKDKVGTFLNTLTPRVGPMNAMNLMKDAHISAFAKLFQELGISKEKIDEVIGKTLDETAQKVLSVTPVPSPIQRMN